MSEEKRKLMPGETYPEEPSSSWSTHDVEPFFIWAKKVGASDITIQTNEQIILEVDGRKQRVTKKYLSSIEVNQIMSTLYESDVAAGIINGGKDLDFAYRARVSKREAYRYRVNIVGGTTEGQDSVQITARTIDSDPPRLSDLNIEKDILDNYMAYQGMVLITGATGSGKSTLLAAIIREILEDEESNKKIITFEAPIEYVYDNIPKPSCSIFQTQVYKHLESFSAAIRNALRRAPNIILIGEARDPETIREAVTASTTGHLLFTTVHTNGFAETIRRMVTQFPANERNSMALDIVSSLNMVVSQRLLKKEGGGRIAIREYVVMNSEIKEILSGCDLDRLSLVCRRILKTYGRSFYQDALDKYEQGLISKKDLDIIKKQDEAADKDASIKITSNSIGV